MPQSRNQSPRPAPGRLVVSTRLQYPTVEYRPAVAELAARDPVFAALVDDVGPCTVRPASARRSAFSELARMICYQQLAGVAARTIHGRFLALFNGRAPTPEAVLALSDEALRAVGLSGAKAASIRDLAGHASAGTLRLRSLGRMGDDEVVAELTRVRGIGTWTAHMFLMFQLGRLDVWPVGDFGVRAGFARVYGLPTAPTPDELGQLGEPFRPYRSVLAWYCWRALDLPR